MFYPPPRPPEIARRAPKLLILAAFGVASAVSSYAQDAWPTVITEDVTSAIQMTGNYTIEAPDLVLTHNYNAARHYQGTIDLNGYSATFIADVHTGNTSNYFAFNHCTFKGDGPENILDIRVADGGDSIHIMDGFTVDAATVNMDLGAKSAYNASKYTVNVVNNGLLNWTNVKATSVPMILNIGSSATDTARAEIRYNGTAWQNGANEITVNGGSFFIEVGSGRIDCNMTVHALSADSYSTSLSIRKDGTFVIDSGVQHKIYTANSNLVFFDNSTFKSSTTDVLMYKPGSTVKYIGIYIAAAASSITLDLGAMQNFQKVTVAGASAVMNVLLNGNMLSFETIDFSKLDVVITDFENGLFRWKEATNFDVDKITASTLGGGELTDIETVLGADGYTYLYSASVPEPASIAAIFGALALALAAYRRRK